MMSYTNSIKAKSKPVGEISTQNFTYQGEVIRKSITNANNQNLKGTKEPIHKQKTYRKVVTETNQKDFCFDQSKKSQKPFRLPIKASSPQLKKNISSECPMTSNNKLCFSNNAAKIKRVKKPVGPYQKLNTETGPLIQRFHQTEKQKNIITNQRLEKKPIIFREERSAFCESKKQNFVNKKIIDSKSSSNLNLYSKARMNTQGTFDSTPQAITSFDIELTDLIGQGTFGKVFKGRMKKNGQLVAVKRVFQDPKYKNRQVQIVNMLSGQFLMKVIGTYTTFQEGNQYLNIVMNFYEGDLFSYIKMHGRKGLSTFDIKIMTYQIFRGMMFIHSLKIAHRDIKPHNLLYSGKNVVICDFGSAKILTNEPNLPYICSRCYRAPQLIFGATHYTTMIDIWSVGCVILEMINSTPLFLGESSIDHLIEIIKVLGTPTKSQVIDMNPQYDLNDYKFPKIKKREWSQIFPKTDPLLLDLISQIMIYSPKQRLNAAEAIAHEFYDELREQSNAKSIQKKYGLDLFSFGEQQLLGNQHLLSKLLPNWKRQKNLNF